MRIGFHYPIFVALICSYIPVYSSLSAERDRDVSDAIEILVKYLNKFELRDLFCELGLAHSTVQNHFGTSSTNEYADSLLHAWINRRDNVLTKGGATWENLKTALQSIGCGGAANQIDGRKYLLSGDGPPSVSQPSPIVFLTY